jgi:predicted N-acetyltransferase YhbS
MGYHRRHTLESLLSPPYNAFMPVMNSPLTIRPATRADIPALHALIESAYRGDSARQGWTHEADLLDGQRTDPASLNEIIDDPDQRILIALDGSDVIGCVQIARKKNGISYLGLLSVDPLRQATGLGKQLIAAAEHGAATYFGAHVIEMPVIKQRSELIAYYQRRGYSPTGEQRPFPHGDERFGLPKTSELVFVVLAKNIA